LPPPSMEFKAMVETEKWLTDAIPDGMQRKEVAYSVSTDDSVHSFLPLLLEHLDPEPKNVQAPSRQTTMLILPNLFQDYAAFDSFVKDVQSVRSSARTYQHPTALTAMQAEVTRTLADDPVPQMQTSVNLALLHPDFEVPEPDEGDSPELKAYKTKKGLSRRSPYPTLVIETRTRVVELLSKEEEEQMAATSGDSPEGGPQPPAPAPAAEISNLEHLFSLPSTPTPSDPAAAASAALLSPSKKLRLHFPALPVHICPGSTPHSAFLTFFTSTAQPPFVVGYPSFLPSSPLSFERYGRDLQKLCDLAQLGWEVVAEHPEGVGEGKAPVPCVRVEQRGTVTSSE